MMMDKYNRILFEIEKVLSNTSIDCFCLSSRSNSLIILLVSFLFTCKWHISAEGFLTRPHKRFQARFRSARLREDGGVWAEGRLSGPEPETRMLYAAA